MVLGSYILPIFLKDDNNNKKKKNKYDRICRCINIHTYVQYNYGALGIITIISNRIILLTIVTMIFLFLTYFIFIFSNIRYHCII